MRKFVTVISLLFCLVTCNIIGQLDLAGEKENENSKTFFTSIESDLPADLDLLADSIANDVREFYKIPDIVHVMHGKYGDAIETNDSLRGANLVSSHGDTLFLLPVDPGTLSDRVKIPIEDAIEIKLIEMAKK